MSKSKEIKGRKAAKKDNQAANRGYRKHVPYGALKKATYSSDDELVGIVNKSKERQQTKLHLKNILSQPIESDEDEFTQEDWDDIMLGD